MTDLRNLPPTFQIRAGRTSLHHEFLETIRHRHLISMLTWRELAARHKQSILGFGFAILQPIMMLVVFTFVFGHVAKVSTDGTPYVVFAAAGVLPWMFLQKSVTASSMSLVSFGGIFSKVYAPRLIAPIVGVCVNAVDFILSLAVLAGVMVFYALVPGWQALLLPLGLVFGVFLSLSFSLFAAALNVDYRDVRHMLPYIMQVLMYFSPVAYPTSAVPDGLLRNLYQLNPIATYLDVMRWMMIGTDLPGLVPSLASLAIAVVMFVVGLRYFLVVARTFADRL